MKKIAILLLACIPMFGSAAGKTATATMQVSFTVTESCTVQRLGKQPQVECTADTPFQLQDHPAGRLSMNIASNDGQPTVVYF